MFPGPRQGSDGSCGLLAKLEVHGVVQIRVSHGRAVEQGCKLCVHELAVRVKQPVQVRRPVLRNLHHLEQHHRIEHLRLVGKVGLPFLYRTFVGVTSGLSKATGARAEQHRPEQLVRSLASVEK